MYEVNIVTLKGKIVKKIYRYGIYLSYNILFRLVFDKLREQ